MSDIFGQDLFSKLITVPAIANFASFTAGGGASDPAMTKIPLPAAWVLLAGDMPVDKESGAVPITQILQIEYVVMVLLPYTSQSDILNTQIPLLRAIRKSIHGTLAPNGFLWKYTGQKLAKLNPDRMGYEQRFVVRVGM